MGGILECSGSGLASVRQLAPYMLTSDGVHGNAFLPQTALTLRCRLLSTEKTGPVTPPSRRTRIFSLSLLLLFHLHFMHGDKRAVKRVDPVSGEIFGLFISGDRVSLCSSCFSTRLALNSQRTLCLCLLLPRVLGLKVTTAT